MQHVKGYYIDAKDGIPSNVAPLRHGPALPHVDLTIDFVDYREQPPLIVGQLPAAVALPESLTKITKTAHTKLTQNHNAWREQLEAEQAERDKQARIVEIDARLLELDAFSARPMRSIINETATLDDRQILEGYETEALQLRAERDVLNGN